MTKKSEGMQPSSKALIQKAKSGDTQALARLKKTHPQDLEDYLKRFAGLGEEALNHLVQLMSGDDRIEAERLKRQARHLATQLAGAQPSQLEQLLIERIVLCWIQAHHADIIYHQNMVDKSWRARDYMQRGQDRTQRRFLQACKALAQVRKLLGPTIQLNVAQNQVNVQGTPG